MDNKLQVLIIATYGIDISFGFAEELEKQGYMVTKADNAKTAIQKMNDHRFDNIMLNLEPDGCGGIWGVELIPIISAHPKQKSALYLGVSTQSPLSLADSDPQKQAALSILHGWLTIPILGKRTAEIFADSQTTKLNENDISAAEIKILIISTYGIDICFGLQEELVNQGCEVKTATSREIAETLLQEQPFDSILLNLEPDGKGGVAGMDLVNIIGSHPRQSGTVCFGVSTLSPLALLPTTQNPQNDFSIFAGWLIIPINSKQTAHIIIDLVHSRNSLQ